MKKIVLNPNCSDYVVQLAELINPKIKPKDSKYAFQYDKKKDIYTIEESYKDTTFQNILNRCEMLICLCKQVKYSYYYNGMNVDPTNHIILTMSRKDNIDADDYMLTINKVEIDYIQDNIFNELINVLTYETIKKDYLILFNDNKQQEKFDKRCNNNKIVLEQRKSWDEIMDNIKAHSSKNKEEI